MKMSSFACAFILLLSFFIIILDGSPAESYKKKEIKKSSLRAVNPGIRKAKIKSLPNSKNNHIYKRKKGHQKPVRRLKKMMVKPKKKHGSKVDNRIRTQIHKKKKKILPKFKLDKGKNKQVILYKHRKPKKVIFKKKRRKNALHLKKQRKILKAVPSKASPLNTESNDEVIKKGSNKHVSENKKEMEHRKLDLNTSTSSTVPSKVLLHNTENEVFKKHVSENKKEMEHTKSDLETSTSSSLLTSTTTNQKKEVTMSLIKQKNDFKKSHHDAKETCVIDGNCISLNKLFERFPDAANKITEWWNPRFNEFYKVAFDNEIVGPRLKRWKKRLDVNGDALSILLAITEEFGNADCFTLSRFFPFLKEMFVQIQEPCT